VKAFQPEIVKALFDDYKLDINVYHFEKFMIFICDFSTKVTYTVEQKIITGFLKL